MKSFKDLRIGTKLYVGFGFVLTLLVTVVYLSHQSEQTVTEGFTFVLDTPVAAQFAADEVEMYMLQARRSEKDFLLRKDLKYVDHVDQSLAGLKEGVEVIYGLAETAGRQDAMQQLNTIKEHADVYQSRFHEVSDAWVAKGLDHKSGLQGQFRDAAGELGTMLAETNEPTLMVDLLTIRKHEKDYLLRDDQKYVAKVQEQLAAMRLNALASSLSDDDKQTLRDLAGNYESLFLALVEQDKGIAIKTGAMREAVHSIDPLIEAVREMAKSDVGAVSEEIKASAAAELNLTLALAGAALLIGIFIAWFIARLISRPITKVVTLTEHMNNEFDQFVGVVDRIAQNDLTQQIEQSEIENIGVNSKDEIGTLVRAIEGTLEAKGKIGGSLQTMTANLTTMIRQMGDNSTQLVSAATEVASSAEQMSRGARDQTDQTTQVGTAVEEMTATIVESSRNAGEATEGARSAADTATAGGQIVNDTIQGMQRIADVVRESADSIGKLAKSADQIGEIISVIDDIADQTNLLALNAAIEAARAGEQGRGFAVVADEVRKLAERTGKATGEITSMIKGIQEETTEAVGSMETGITEVDAGRELADRAGSSLTEIVNLSQSVQDMIAQIATAAEEQSSAAEQISKNVENVSSIATESAKGAEQSAAAAEQLNRQAEGMQQMVARFKIAQDA